jgi:cellulose synthase/poly-beta-1,6-N-acetylglucosamine synthase-like glycosyltransferase
LTVTWSRDKIARSFAQEEERLVILTALYLIACLWLSVYGYNAFVLILLYLVHARKHKQVDCPPLLDLPTVTVQLPIYNERYVVQRAIEAVASLDWPRDRLQIQVLDDSTDETTGLARAQIERYQGEGIDITHVCRQNRAGYKAGALNAAMPDVRGEYIAIFDADFLPRPNFLRRTVPHLVAQPDLGFVQARWGHLNDSYSLLTLAQAIALDGHLAIEHPARARAGWMTSFNGTGGVWRTKCVEESGGWDPEQLTEDVDLSYRAQLAGWRGLPLPDVAAPAELPVQLAAFKQQQFRWAKGNIQCLLKLGPDLIRAKMPFPARLQALIHLSYYFAHPLMLIVMLSTLPLISLDAFAHWSLAWLSLATLGPPLLYVLGQRAIYPDWRRRLRALPVLVCIGIGLALNGTAAAIEAVLGIKSPFQRTPKFLIQGRTGNWKNRSYTLSAGGLIWGEILLTIYSVLVVIVALRQGQILAIPFLLLYVFGFGYVSLVGIVQTNRKQGETQQSSVSPQ